MTKITDTIWLGNSEDADHADLRPDKIGAILNVAHDLQCSRGWSDGIEYAQCGLVDGPGNTMAAYHAAMLKLAALVTGGRRTLVVDHVAGGRAIAVIIMGLHAMRRMGWVHWAKVIAEAVAKRTLRDHQDKCYGEQFCQTCHDLDTIVHASPLPSVHEKHKRAFDRINWRLVTVAMEG